MAAWQTQRPSFHATSASAWCAPTDCLSTACSWAPILARRSACSLPRLCASVGIPPSTACREEWAGSFLAA
eukprot:5648505-Pyramimonas_sp.AAC.1